MIRLYGFHGPNASPDKFLDDLATAAERDAEQLDEVEEASTLDEGAR